MRNASNLMASLLVLTLLPGAQGQTNSAQAQSTSAPLTITLQDALQRARSYSPQFQSAVAATGIARQDRVQARAAFLPSVNYTTQYLYTEGNHTLSGVFIANNAVHEYLSQGNAHEALDLGPGQIAAYHRSQANIALARAQQEIAARGLVVTVVREYYGLVVAQRKYADAQHAQQDAQNFVKLSQELEQGGEVAHADVIKAQLQLNNENVALREAELAMNDARLSLAVLLFPNFNQDFTVVDDLNPPPALPGLPEIEKLAAENNPNLRVAMSALNIAKNNVAEAWSGHLPTLALDYWYGIDADHFATYTGNIRNLGYSAAATLYIPIWNWGSVQSKVHQAQYQEKVAQVEVSAAQRQAVADLQSFYSDSRAALDELNTLSNSVSLASESLRLTTLRYRAGEATALEVVDAQDTLVLAQNAFADAQARYRVSLATLQTLTGPF